MTIQSLGLKTDLFFVKFNGHIIEKEDYYVVRTPSNPDYWFGNFLIFKEPPIKGGFEKWKNIFIDEIKTGPEISHMLFTWDRADGATGETSEFTSRGFRFEKDVVLSTDKVNPPQNINSHITIRKLVSDEDWEKGFENQISCRDESFDENLDDHKQFKRKQMANYREMANQKLGDWYGAFLGDQLVCDMGLYFVDGVGRFQSVGTHPNYRRQGICGTMVYEISRMALEKHNVQNLVMIADENYHAARIYESVGFKPCEHLVHLLHSSFFKTD